MVVRLTLLLPAMVAVHLHTLKATRFQPNISTTFEALNDRFFVQYLDNAYLSGFVAQDYIRLGRYTAMTRFGCITSSKGHDWWNADGILGLGLPGTALPQVPNPLLYALSDGKQSKQKELQGHVHIMGHRIFTLVLGSGDGELQLGGYDKASVEGKMVSADVLGDTIAGKPKHFLHYRIQVDGVRLGKHQLLHFAKNSVNETLLNQTDDAAPLEDDHVEAVLDSGTSCLVLPDSTFDGRLAQSPYRIFKQLWVNLDNPSLFFKIGGEELEMKYEQYMVDGRACVMRMKNAPETFLLGGIFFQHVVVVHDLQNSSQPRVIIGRRNEHYQLGGDMPIEAGTVAENEAGSRRATSTRSSVATTSTPTKLARCRCTLSISLFTSSRWMSAHLLRERSV